MRTSRRRLPIPTTAAPSFFSSSSSPSARSFCFRSLSFSSSPSSPFSSASIATSCSTPRSTPAPTSSPALRLTRPPRPLAQARASWDFFQRTMASSAADKDSRIFFGPFDVTTQVFYTTPYSFALVNLRPLLPGHVLVCPRRPHRRLTDLSRDELADLFAAVQVVQRMLAAYYFGADEQGQKQQEVQGKQPQQPQQPQQQPPINGQTPPPSSEVVHNGSFNLAVQDGPEAGQTVAHVHVHVLPRIRGTSAKDAATDADAVYEQMAAEPGNVGGAQWDHATAQQNNGELGPRPRPGGRFPRIEDSSRVDRTMEAMEAEAAAFRRMLEQMGVASSGPAAAAAEGR